MCKLLWGAQGVFFEGVLTGLTQTFTLFLPIGSPVRARLECSFDEWISARREGLLQHKQSPDVAKTRVVHRGDTLSAIAAAEYDDPALWRPIALANRIVDPLALDPGRVLIIPVLPAPPSSPDGQHMSVPQGAPELSPAFEIRVGGVPLAPDAAAGVISVSVHQDTELPGMFTVRLWNSDEAKLRVTWSDSDIFAPGAPVQIRMGYTGSPLRNVFSGDITGLELESDADEPLTVLVRGYDRRHRLMRGQLTRSYVQVTDSAIARRIASDRGLAAVVTETRVVFDHVLQHNQTDLDFLTGRAALIGYEVVVEDRTLYFRPHRRPRVATGSCWPAPR